MDNTIPDEELIILSSGYFTGWKDRIALLFGRTIHVRINQPVWFKFIEPGVIGLATKPAKVTVTVERLFDKRPLSEVSAVKAEFVDE